MNPKMLKRRCTELFEEGKVRASSSPYIAPIVMADLQKMVIRYPLRESGMGGCVGKGNGTEEMRTLEVLDLKWEF